MRYLLDTNIWSFALRGDAAVLAHLSTTHRDELAVSSVTWAELEYGSIRHPFPDRHRSAWRRLLTLHPVLDFDREAALEHARLREATRHEPIGERDLLIAAIATAHALAVVTHNVREFRRVPRLRVLDWTKA